MATGSYQVCPAPHPGTAWSNTPPAGKRYNPEYYTSHPTQRDLHLQIIRANPSNPFMRNTFRQAPVAPPRETSWPPRCSYRVQSVGNPYFVPPHHHPERDVHQLRVPEWKLLAYPLMRRR